MFSSWGYWTSLLIIISVNTLDAFPTQFFPPLCNCIRVIDCKPFSSILLDHDSRDKEAIFKFVRNAGCGFLGRDPLACCPRDIKEIKLHRHADSEEEIGHLSGTFSPDYWVWGRRPINSVPDRLGEFQDNVFKNVNKLDRNVLDYKDTKTQLNNPHAFYDAINEEFGEKFVHHHPHLHKYHFAHEEEDDPEYTTPDSGEIEISHHVSDGDDSFDTALSNGEDKFFHHSFGFPHTPFKSNLNPSHNEPDSPSDSKESNKDAKVVGNAGERALINSPQCGISVGTLILGGLPSTPGQYPWITRIAYLNSTSNRISYRCSGSVISDLYSLTAAHCVVNLVTELSVSHLRIGDAAVSLDGCGDDSNSCSMSRIFEISDVIVHPGYDRPKYANDIALVKFIRPQNTEFNYGTICLPLNNSADLVNRLVGSTGIVAGWSTNSQGVETTNATVKFLRLPIVNNTECAITYSKYSENSNDPIVITPGQLCAQGQPMNDVCRGDSGGPFMDDGMSGLINSNGRHTLLGIVAFGPTACGVSSFPGVYTRISSYMEWIVANIR